MTPNEEGSVARLRGETMHQNPYTNWTQVHGQWNDGWREQDNLQAWIRHGRIGTGRGYQQEVQRAHELEARNKAQGE